MNQKLNRAIDELIEEAESLRGQESELNELINILRRGIQNLEMKKLAR